MDRCKLCTAQIDDSDVKLGGGIGKSDVACWQVGWKVGCGAGTSDESCERRIHRSRFVFVCVHGTSWRKM